MNIWYIITIWYLYSFTGWVWEVLLGLFQRNKLVNRGFLIGPLCPIYGFGGVIITVLLKQFILPLNSVNVMSNVYSDLFVFVVSTVICSVLEYFTSWLMEKLFKARWWDYSHMNFNINGRICLMCSLGFGIGALLILKLIDPMISKVILSMNTKTLITIDSILMVITLVDFLLSFKIVSNIKNISTSIKSDNTEKITKKVKETIVNNYSVMYKRLINAFPDVKINNSLSILRTKINKEKERLDKEKTRIKSKISKLKTKEKKLNNITSKERLNDFINKLKGK